MKKSIIFILIFILAFSKLGNTQSTRWGLIGGANFTGIVGEEKPDPIDYKLSYNGGVYFEFRFAENQSFQFELNYLRRAYDFTEDIPALEPHDAVLNVVACKHYIAIPLKYKLLTGNKRLSSFVDFGVQANFNIDNKDNLSAYFDGKYLDPYTYYYYEDSFYEYGFAGGIGIQYKALIFRTDAFLSLQNAFKGDKSREMRYFNVMLNIGYQLNYIRPRKFRQPRR